MLYVLRKIPFPDASGRHRPKPLYWMIADLNKAPGHHSKGEPSAVSKMQTWLYEVNEAKGRLNLDDKLERLVADMLAANPNQRATTKRVISELRAEQLPAAG